MERTPGIIKMELQKYKIFWLNLKNWRILYGMVMFFSFLNLPFSINNFIYKREYFNLISIILWIIFIFITYFFIMFLINPLIEKYGEKAPLILSMFKNRSVEKHA